MWKSLVLFLALAMGIVSGLRAEEAIDRTGADVVEPSIAHVIIAD